MIFPKGQVIGLSIAPELLKQSKETSWFFLALKLIEHLNAVMQWLTTVIAHFAQFVKANCKLTLFVGSSPARNVSDGCSSENLQKLTWQYVSVAGCHGQNFY